MAQAVYKYEDDENDRPNDGGNNNNNAENVEEEKIRVIFKLASDCTDETLRLPPDLASLAIPANVGRQGLSTIVNHLLERGNETKEDGDDDDDDEMERTKLPVIPLEFIVGPNHHRLLRTGLEREARQSGLSLEDALEITYFPALPAPQPLPDPQTVPDWIASLQYEEESPQQQSSSSSSSTTNRPLLCAAGYDGSIHVFSCQKNSSSQTAGGVQLEKLVTVPQANQQAGPIKCFRAVACSSPFSVWMASGSMDHSLFLHRFQPNQKRDEPPTVQWAAHCQGHSAAVSQVDLMNTSASKRVLASADWDGHVCLWDCSDEALADAASTATAAKQDSKKRSKLNNSTQSQSSSSSSHASLSPVIMLPAHSSQVSGLSWGNHHKVKMQQDSSNVSSRFPEELISASWDHSIKVWNVERQDCLLTLNGSRVVTCLDSSYYSPGIVATGHPDCTIRLWDVRVQQNGNAASMVSDNTFRPSHQGWVSDVKWSPHNPYHLGSTSHDGTIKLWDIRSSVPLHTVRAFAKNVDKGLCLAFGCQEDGIVFAGGTDCIVKQFAGAKVAV